MREHEEFQPTTALGRSLPGAIFLSMLAMYYVPSPFESLTPFEFASGVLREGPGLVATLAFGVITPLWNGLAIAYVLRCKEHDFVRRCFLVFNLIGILVWTVAALKFLVFLKNLTRW
jgi:hypothetical protein